ncbi:transporter substrate-binding domain-containing protein [Streptomyces brevispora]|uniref:Transporter substrate-binding domain-containing protein n=1 Tax=Streptomyces brevispora TaxID=887462 RepID=A0ABZ1G2Y9_9ACTN|nr:transporter substrate-binding domain-containing protein [Streptomyces brevispora]WSC14245.1 transporter substrate-binding domain-containing protein [Streptomyces brevispora]
MIVRLRHRRTLAASAVLALLVVELSGCHGGTSEEPLPKDHSQILVGVKNNQPGLSQTLQGETLAEGFEPSLAEKLIPPYKSTQTMLNADTWRESLRGKRSDIAFSSISVNDSRRKERFIFAGPYLKSPLGALALRGKKVEPNTLRKLNVCYVKNTTAAKLVEDERKNDVSIGGIQKDTTQGCLDALLNAADIFLSDEVILVGLIEHPDKGKSSPYKLIDESSLRNASDQSYGIALRSQEKPLCRKLSQKLNKVLQNPTNEWAEIFRSTVANGNYTVDEANKFKPDGVNPEWCE